MHAQAYDLLTSSVADYNAWKQEQTEDVSLEGADLSEHNLTGANLAGVNLKNANLSRCRLDDANLENAILYQAVAEEASFWRTRLNKVYAADARLDGASLRQCRIEETSFVRASLDKATFDHSLIVDAKFDGASLRGARFHGALLVSASFEGADLRAAQTAEATTRQPGKKAPETHLEFYWISDEGDDYALGPLVLPADGEADAPFTASIRRFRKGDAELTKQFARLVAAVIKKHHRLSDCTAIVPVPSSNPGSGDSPVYRLCEQISKLTELKDGSGWLARHKAAMPARLFLFSGPDPDKHMNSIRVANPGIVAGRSIVLLDDFIHSGATSGACRELLKEAGAKKVLGVYLARRVN